MSSAPDTSCCLLALRVAFLFVCCCFFLSNGGEFLFMRVVSGPAVVLGLIFTGLYTLVVRPAVVTAPNGSGLFHCASKGGCV